MVHRARIPQNVASRFPQLHSVWCPVKFSTVSVRMHERDQHRLAEIVRITRHPAQEVLRRLVRRFYRDEIVNGAARQMFAEDIGLTHSSTNHQ